ncbi:MAG: hypothetical protein ACPG19_06065 [Saprospiraceae bacterium]
MELVIIVLVITCVLLAGAWFNSTIVNYNQGIENEINRRALGMGRSNYPVVGMNIPTPPMRNRNYREREKEASLSVWVILFIFLAFLFMMVANSTGRSVSYQEDIQKEQTVFSHID